MTNQPAPSDTPTPRTDAELVVIDCIVHGQPAQRTVIMPKFCRQLERELTRLSAEREKERRVEQCCECNAYVSDWVEAEHRNGRICRPCESLISVRATLAERDRQLAEAKDIGDVLWGQLQESRVQLADSQRQKAELEGRLKLALRGLEMLNISAQSKSDLWLCEQTFDLIQSLRQSTQTEEE